MRQSFLYAIILSLLSFTGITAQSPDLKETFLEAESYFLFEEYNEALPLYLKIHRAAPENNNINYKIGICLLNDPYQKEKSIGYLEQAVKDINPKYKENNFKETTAPPEAYFYLGNAYLVNNLIDKALENYNYFLKILDEKIYDVELVEEQIRICHRAKDLQKIPVNYDRINLSENINSRFADINPVVSGNGKHLVYVSKRQFYDATYYSEKVEGVWLPPRNIIPELEVDGDVYPTSLSWDGDTMIIYRNDDFIGNLYISRLEDGRWTGLEKLHDNINTKYWESHGSLSKDGKTLYFTSNRKGGYGGLDIYRSEKQEDGTWGNPENLGDIINSRYNEETPFISENGQKLFFSSYGHFNMGGYDIFFSKKGADGNWDTPVNLGYPINTTDDDLFYYPVNNGINAYMSKYLPGGYGGHDIYYVDIYSENNPRMYLITGTVRTKQGEVTSEDSLAIYLVDRETDDTIYVGKPDLTTQTFGMETPEGSYNLIFKSSTFKDRIRKIDINEETDKAGIRFDDPVELEPKKYIPLMLTGTESRIRVRDSVFRAEPGEPFSINLWLDNEVMLYTKHFADSLLIRADTLEVDSSRFALDILPVEGENRLEMIMEEENGDRSFSKVDFTVPKSVKKPITKDKEVAAPKPAVTASDKKVPPPAEEEPAVPETLKTDTTEVETPASDDSVKGISGKQQEPDQEVETTSGEPKISKELKIVGGLLLAGLLFILIFFFRRRKKEEEKV